MPEPKKRILLVDLEDGRRVSRVHLLTHAGYEVDVRNDHVDAERLADEGEFDLVIVALHLGYKDAAAYSERLHRSDPTLPVLLLTDNGVYVPQGMLSRDIQTGSPVLLMKEIGELLAGSSHIREIRTTV